MPDPSNALTFSQTLLASVTGGAVVGAVSIITARMGIRAERKKQNRLTRFEEARRALILLGEDLTKTLNFASEQGWSDAIYAAGSGLVFAFIGIGDALSICIPTLEQDFSSYSDLRLEVITLRSKMGKEPLRPVTPTAKILLEKSKALAEMGGDLQRSIRSEFRTMIGTKRRVAFSKALTFLGHYVLGLPKNPPLKK